MDPIDEAFDRVLLAAAKQQAELEAEGWNFGKPPHNETVEAWYNHQVVRGKAIWGDRDKGVIPHWEFENGLMVEARGVTRWRRI